MLTGLSLRLKMGVTEDDKIFEEQVSDPKLNQVHFDSPLRKHGTMGQDTY